MATKLIQELVGLWVEKFIDFHIRNDGFLSMYSNGYRFTMSVDIWCKSAPSKLQAAIEKVKAL